MKIRADDLRKRYAEMADVELLSLDRSELVEMARECFDAEIARRGLKQGRVAAIEGSDAEEAPIEAEAEVDEPVAVRTFTFQDQASIARELLRAAEIPCFLENEHLLSINWNLTNALGGLRLMVPGRFADRALEVLEDADVGAREPVIVETWDGHVNHRFVETNGIRMHIAEAGNGPLVLLLHGFPELWNSWRHQLSALAEAGYRAVAPDLRGYGQTDRPEPLEAYDIFQLTGDIVGLVHALEGEPALLVGHDWGASIAAHCALLRPELFRAVVLVSVPFMPRRSINQSQWEAQKYPSKVFYQAILRSPAAEQFFSADVRGRLLSAFWTLSGDMPPADRWKPVRDPGSLLVTPPLPPGLPTWLAEEDLNFLAGEYQRTGFTGGLNYYRNMDRNWGLTPFLDGAKLLHRTLFLAGSEDPVLEFLGQEYADLEQNVPNLWKKVLIPRAGHWIQQERPQEVNRLLLQFLGELEAGERAR